MKMKLLIKYLNLFNFTGILLSIISINRINTLFKTSQYPDLTRKFYIQTIENFSPL